MFAPRTWVLVEGRLAGTLSQCMGVANALGISPEIKQFSLRQPWRNLVPYISCGAGGLGLKNGDIQPPWPELILCGGRQGTGLALWIKRASKGKTFVACLQDPRVKRAAFDLIAVPAHDPARGPNVTLTTGAPNKITPNVLEHAAAHWQSSFAHLPQPRVAVLIGGKSRAYDLTPAIMTTLAQQLKTLATNAQAGLMVTASRRTGAQNRSILMQALQSTNAYMWDGTGDNPYLGMLALADAIIVSADSVSMLSEAATTGKPVYRLDLAGGTPRLNRFHNLLDNKGITRPFAGKIEHWHYTPLQDGQIVANAIKQNMEK